MRGSRGGRGEGEYGSSFLIIFPALPQAEAAAVPVTCASPGVVTLTPSDSETYSYSVCALLPFCCVDFD